MKYTLDTDFSSLNGPKAANWIMGFQDIVLWDYLEGKKAASDFEDFANNLYAATLNYNVGEEITDAQAEFYEKHVDIPWGSTCEWQILTWLSVLLMEVVAISGGRLDFEEYEEYE